MFSAFIASYLVICIGNAPKYAIDKVMSSEAQACFTYIFMPVFVISLFESVRLSAGNQQNGSFYGMRKRSVSSIS